jgi:hypothetical protein
MMFGFTTDPESTEPRARDCGLNPLKPSSLGVVYVKHFATATKSLSKAQREEKSV